MLKSVELRRNSILGHVKNIKRRHYSEQRKFPFKKEELENSLRVTEFHQKLQKTANTTSASSEISEEALRKFNDGNYAEAKVLYDKALSLNPKNTIALQNRGISCIHLDKPVEAILSFDKILETFADPSIFILKGEVILKQGDALNALDCFQNAIIIASRVDRNSQAQTALPDASIAIAHLYSGYGWEDVGDIAEAIISYRKAVEIDSTKGDYFYFLAKALYHMDESEEALEAIQKAVSLEPNFDSYLLQAKINMNFNNYQGALDSLSCITRNQIEVNEQMWDYYAIKGLALWNLSLFSESLEAINIALDNYVANPNEEEERKGSNKAILFHNRGAVQLSLNCIDLALNDFKMASELDPENPEHLKKYNEVETSLKVKQKVNSE